MTAAGGAKSGLRVIGAGMGRTGTASLKRALEELGFGPCHHMEEVVKNPSEVPTWERAARGETIDWRTFLAPWGSAVDFPAALYWRELMEAFPDAKVVLSVRSAESWYESFGQTIVPAIRRWPNRWVTPFLPYVNGPGRVMAGTMLKNDLVARYDERDHVIAKFNAWNEEVKRVVPKERLLVHEAKDGWKPLCDFLGVPVPSTPYPRVNDTKEFQKRNTAATVISSIVLLLPVAIALSILAAVFR